MDTFNILQDHHSQTFKRCFVITTHLFQHVSLSYIMALGFMTPRHFRVLEQDPLTLSALHHGLPCALSLTSCMRKKEFPCAVICLCLRDK